MARSVAALLAALAIGLAGILPGLAAAEATDRASGLSRIVSSGTLRVGMSGSQPPLNFKGKDGTIRGLEVDLAQSLAGLMGVELQIVETPFAELLDALAAGRVDLVSSGMTATPERSLRTAFIGPYFLSGKSILTRSASLAAVQAAGELDQASLTFAALDGSTSEQFVRNVLPKAKVVTTPDYDKAVELLLADKVSALVADREVVSLTAFLHPKEGLASLRTPLTIEPIGLAVPVADAPLIHYLHNALNALEVGGILSAHRARWLERGDWVGELP